MKKMRIQIKKPRKKNFLDWNSIVILDQMLNFSWAMQMKNSCFTSWTTLLQTSESFLLCTLSIRPKLKQIKCIVCTNLSIYWRWAVAATQIKLNIIVFGFYANTMAYNKLALKLIVCEANSFQFQVWNYSANIHPMMRRCACCLCSVHL